MKAIRGFSGLYKFVCIRDAFIMNETAHAPDPICRGAPDAQFQPDEAVRHDRHPLYPGDRQKATTEVPAQLTAAKDILQRLEDEDPIAQSARTPVEPPPQKDAFGLPITSLCEMIDQGFNPLNALKKFLTQPAQKVRDFLDKALDSAAYESQNGTVIQPKDSPPPSLLRLVVHNACMNLMVHFSLSDVMQSGREKLIKATTIDETFRKAIINGDVNAFTARLNEIADHPEAVKSQAQELDPKIKIVRPLECRDSFGNSPLMLAALKAEPEMVAQILAQKVAINAPNSSKTGLHGDRDDSTALHLAVSPWYTETSNPMDSTSSRGAIPETDAEKAAFVEKRVKIIHQLAKAGANFNARDWLGNTPLQNALKDKEPAYLKALLEAGADPDYTGPAGSHGTISGVYDNGTPWKLVHTQTTRPLIMAVKTRNAELVKLLLEANADASLPGEHGSTPLLAALYASPELVRPLLDHGAAKTIHQAENQGNTTCTALERAEDLVKRFPNDAWRKDALQWLRDAAAETPV